MWMGVVTRTHASYVSMSEGVARTWTLKRTGDQERWKTDEALAMRGATQQPDTQRQVEEVTPRIMAERTGQAASTTTRRAARCEELLHQEKRRDGTWVHAGVQGTHCSTHAEPRHTHRDIRTLA